MTKTLIQVLWLILCYAVAAGAQGLPAQSLRPGSWQIAPLAGGGTGLGKSDSTQFFFAGVRIGRVVTHEHLPGWCRGNFEYDADFLPLYLVFSPFHTEKIPIFRLNASGGLRQVGTDIIAARPGQTIYGASIKPIILTWNFTQGRKVSPYAQLAGGVVFSSANVPPGDTSHINFTPQGGVGVHIFRRAKRAIALETALVHFSSASLGNRNPGYNFSLLFSLGYSWFK